MIPFTTFIYTIRYFNRPRFNNQLKEFCNVSDPEVQKDRKKLIRNHSFFFLLIWMGICFFSAFTYYESNFSTLYPALSSVGFFVVFISWFNFGLILTIICLFTLVCSMLTTVIKQRQAMNLGPRESLEICMNTRKQIVRSSDDWRPCFTMLSLLGFVGTLLSVDMLIRTSWEEHPIWYFWFFIGAYMVLQLIGIVFSLKVSKAYKKLLSEHILHVKATGTTEISLDLKPIIDNLETSEDFRTFGIGASSGLFYFILIMITPFSSLILSGLLALERQLAYATNQ